MDVEETAAISIARVELADLVESLTPEQWDAPSLCADWRVRDIVTHLVLGARFGYGNVVSEFVRARGNFNRMVHDSAVRQADRPIDELVADLRSIIESRRHPPGTTHLDSLADILVHTQDIAVPLGHRVAMPPVAARTASEQLWRRGFPHHARRRLADLRIEATDVEWARGAGPLVAGPIASVVLLLAGRAASLRNLSGDGVPEARKRLSR